MDISVVNMLWFKIRNTKKGVDNAQTHQGLSCKTIKQEITEMSTHLCNCSPKKTLLKYVQCFDHQGRIHKTS